MKSSLFYAKRELRRKKAQFLPFFLICAALAFTCVSLLILGASLDRGSREETLALIEEGVFDYEHNGDALNENSLMTPMYFGVNAVLLFVFCMASAVLFAIRNEEDAAELGMLRTLGMKRRDLLRVRQIASEPHMPSAFDTDVMTPSSFRNSQTYGDAYLASHKKTEE